MHAQQRAGESVLTEAQGDHERLQQARHALLRHFDRDDLVDVSDQIKLL